MSGVVLAWVDTAFWLAVAAVCAVALAAELWNESRR